MKKLIGVAVALLISTPVVATDVAIQSSERHVVVTWVVMDGEIYFCDIESIDKIRAGQLPKCYRAKKIIMDM